MANEAGQVVTLIYARASNGVIGRDGALPWHLPADLKHFKTLTMNKPMIMGRKTFESLPGLLPGRRHLVLTRDKGWSRAGAETVHSLEEALAIAGTGEIMVIGGAAIYGLFLPAAHRIELTQIHADYDGDTHMAEAGADWTVTAREDYEAHGDRPAYSFLTLERSA